MPRAPPQCLQGACCQSFVQVFPPISKEPISISKPSQCRTPRQNRASAKPSQNQAPTPSTSRGGGGLGACGPGEPPHQAHPAEVSDHDRNDRDEDDDDDDENIMEESEESGESGESDSSPKEDTREKSWALDSALNMIDSVLMDPPPFARPSAPRPSARPPPPASDPPLDRPMGVAQPSPPLALPSPFPCPSLRTHFLFVMVVTIQLRTYKY
jgi:hypothetical protein